MISFPHSAQNINTLKSLSLQKLNARSAKNQAIQKKYYLCKKIRDMKIGFDGKRANANNTGLGNYSRFVVGSLAENYAENKYLMYIPRHKANREYDAIVQAHTSVESLLPQRKLWRGALRSLWRTKAIVGDIRRDGIDIYHGLSNELPVGIHRAGCRSVVTIHDLIYARFPELFKPIDRWIYGLKFKYACRHSDAIIAVSDCTKRDIVEFFGTDPDKISVIYQGCDPQFARLYSQEQKEACRTKYNLPKRFISSVGTLEERKNILLAVKALEHLPTDIHLVACGRNTPYSERVAQYAAEHGLAERVHLISGVSYTDLPLIYQLSEVMVYPSRFEGFGIPIIEAQSSHIPVVAATGSCLEEAGGDAALYVAPDDDEALAEAVSKILGDEKLRTTMVDKGLENVKRFTREKIASDIEALYKSLIKG